MIDQITTNNEAIESYYNASSIHGEMRLMLHKYIYDSNILSDIIEFYANYYSSINNVKINMEEKTISFDTKDSTRNFQNDFSDSMYKVMAIGTSSINKLNECIDLFEQDNPKYKDIKNMINSLREYPYYITLFRAAFIKHEDCTSCIVQL